MWTVLVLRLGLNKSHYQAPVKIYSRKKLVNNTLKNIIEISVLHVGNLHNYLAKTVIH
jgi:hypothetical protein